MALSRKSLSVMGIEDDKIDEIITMHTETVNGLKAEIDKYKEDAEKLADVTKKLEKAQKDLESYQNNEGKDVYKVKYEELKKDFDDFKKDISAKETRSNKEKAYKELLKEAGIPDKRLDRILKVMDVDSLTFDDDGKVEGKDKLIEDIKSEWSDFIETTQIRGSETATPPANNGGKQKLTKEDIKKIKNTTERQKAWAEYLSENEKG